MTLASAPVAARASTTVSKTGRHRWDAPPFPGTTPPTVLVAYAIACSEWKVPFLPVNPWQMTLVFLSIRIAMGSGLSCCDNLAGSILEIAGRNNIKAGPGENFLAESHVGSLEPHDQRHAKPGLLNRRNNPLGDHIAFHDAAEDIDEDSSDPLIGGDELESLHHPVFRRAAADVEKIRRLAAIKLDDVHRRHRKARAVNHAADRTIKRDVIQFVFCGFDLLRIFFAQIAQSRNARMTVERVVVEGYFGV